MKKSRCKDNVYFVHKQVFFENKMLNTCYITYIDPFIDYINITYGL